MSLLNKKMDALLVAERGAFLLQVAISTQYIVAGEAEQVSVFVFAAVSRVP